MKEAKNVKFRDVLNFIELLRDKGSILYGINGFDHGKDIIIVRAPARLDLMGGIADYCGANVFEVTLANSLIMGSQLRDDNYFKVLSIGAENDGLKESFCIHISEFYDSNRLKDYGAIKAFFKKDGRPAAWAGYCLGVFYVLLKEGKIDAFKNGLTMVVKSNIPMGTGISSSAAFEVATMASAAVQYDLNLEPLEFARLAQITENRVVGAPCGIMDQITCALGDESKVISILCQPDKILELVNLPENVQIVGINSRVKRSTGGAAYIDARTGAFMGLTIISRVDPSLNGYLCNVSVKELRDKHWDMLPVKISGQEFLDKYGETIDPVTQVDPDKIYMVRSRSEHPIYENERVKKFIRLLKSAKKSGNNGIPGELIEAGKLMYASHWSYRQKVGLGSKNVDAIVNKVREIGPAGGFLGAKITGGGAGGTAAVLCYGDASGSIQKVLEYYEAETEFKPILFNGSSPGAFKFGYVKYSVKKN